MNHLEHLKSNKEAFFSFMNEDFTLFQHSNLFFRDLQYAIISYFKLKEEPVKYAKAETLASEFIQHLVSDGELSQIDHKSWKVNFEVGLKHSEPEIEGIENE